MSRSRVKNRIHRLGNIWYRIHDLLQRILVVADLDQNAVLRHVLIVSSSFYCVVLPNPSA